MSTHRAGLIPARRPASERHRLLARPDPETAAAADHPGPGPRSLGGPGKLWGVTSETYRLSEDPAELDMDRIFDWLSNDAYWALGRDRSVVDRSFSGAYPAGIYLPSGQVAVARIVSDGATFAWLCDVYVDGQHRGLGLGTRLVQWALDWVDRRGIPRILLATRDAHAVYGAAGFEPLRDPGRWMEIDRRPGVGRIDASVAAPAETDTARPQAIFNSPSGVETLPMTATTLPGTA